MIQGLDNRKFIANCRINFFKIVIVVFHLVNDFDGSFAARLFVNSPEDFSKPTCSNLVLDFVKLLNVFSELTGMDKILGAEFVGSALGSMTAIASVTATGET